MLWNIPVQLFRVKCPKFSALSRPQFKFTLSPTQHIYCHYFTTRQFHFRSLPFNLHFHLRHPHQSINSLHFSLPPALHHTYCPYLLSHNFRSTPTCQLHPTSIILLSQIIHSALSHSHTIAFNNTIVIHFAPRHFHF